MNGKTLTINKTDVIFRLCLITGGEFSGFFILYIVYILNLNLQLAKKFILLEFCQQIV